MKSYTIKEGIYRTNLVSEDELKEILEKSFSKQVFIDKLKLRGQARQGQPRQYGKVNSIKDIEKYMKYYIIENYHIINLLEKVLKELVI